MCWPTTSSSSPYRAQATCRECVPVRRAGRTTLARWTQAGGKCRATLTCLQTSPLMASSQPNRSCLPSTISPSTASSGWAPIHSRSSSRTTSPGATASLSTLARSDCGTSQPERRSTRRNGGFPIRTRTVPPSSLSSTHATSPCTTRLATVLPNSYGAMILLTPPREPRGQLARPVPAVNRHQPLHRCHDGALVHDVLLPHRPVL